MICAISWTKILMFLRLLLQILDPTPVSSLTCPIGVIDAAWSEHLDDDGEVKERHKDEVNQNHTRYHIRYRNWCPDIIPDIVPDWSPDTGWEVDTAPQAQTQTWKCLFSRHSILIGTHEFIGSRPYGKDGSWIQSGKPFKVSNSCQCRLCRGSSILEGTGSHLETLEIL